MQPIKFSMSCGGYFAVSSHWHAVPAKVRRDNHVVIAAQWLNITRYDLGQAASVTYRVQCKGDISTGVT